MEPNIFENILEDLKEQIELLKTIDSWNLEAVKLVWDIILGIIERIEFYSEELETMTSEDKKDMAVKLVNKLVDILKSNTEYYHLRGTDLSKRKISNDW